MPRFGTKATSLHYLNLHLYLFVKRICRTEPLQQPVYITRNNNPSIKITTVKVLYIKMICTIGEV